jgi:YedE family putative selenium metabolism protein
MHAPLLVSLGAALVVGFLAQRSRFCTTGAIRDVILMGETHLLRGVITLVVVATATNLALGQFQFGMAAQPIAHSSHLWNLLGMVLAGLAFSLSGGCPGRQLILSGEGDGDAAVFVLGMITGAAFSHNFSLAAKPDKLVDGVLQVGGVATAGMVAVGLGLVVCVAIGLTMREKLAD